MRWKNLEPPQQQLTLQSYNNLLPLRFATCFKTQPYHSTCRVPFLNLSSTQPLRHHLSNYLQRRAGANHRHKPPKTQHCPRSAQTNFEPWMHAPMLYSNTPTPLQVLHYTLHKSSTGTKHSQAA